MGQLRDLIRVVHADCSVTVGTNAYSVPNTMLPWPATGHRGAPSSSHLRVTRTW